MTIEYVVGDIFSQDVDALVNPVNCVGVMGAGLALQFKLRFPFSYLAYKDSCDDGLVTVGNPFYVPDQGGECNVIHFPTKIHWQGKSKLHFIHDGLCFLANVYDIWNLTSIAMPHIGCGLGGLEWSRVSIILEDILGNSDLRVVAVEYKSTGR